MKRALHATICWISMLFWVCASEPIDDHVLETVAFPEGGGLLWIEHLNDVFRSEGLASQIVFAPVIPRIELSSDLTNDLVMAKWIADVKEEMRVSLSSPESGLSFLRPRASLQAKFIKVREVLALFQCVYGCRIENKDKCIVVYPFPAQYRGICFHDPTSRDSSSVGFIAGSYQGYLTFTHVDYNTRSAYVLAPDEVHQKVMADLRDFGVLTTNLTIKGLSIDTQRGTGRGLEGPTSLTH